MVTLSSINSNLEFKKVASDRLFYNHWNFCVNFHLQEIACIRYSLDSAVIAKRLKNREEWQAQMRLRWTNRLVSPVTKETKEQLHQFAEFLAATSYEYKIVISSNRAAIYANDLEFISVLDNLSMLTHKKFTQAIVTRPENTIAVINPKHKLRGFLRNTKLTSEEKTNLSAFLTTQQEIRISPAMLAWLNTPFSRTQDHFFIDFNDETWLTMLSLVRSGLIRKTFKIVAK
jgi:hypothetical protein